MLHILRYVHSSESVVGCLDESDVGVGDSKGSESFGGEEEMFCSCVSESLTTSWRRERKILC